MPGQHFPPAAIALFVAFFGFMIYRRYRGMVGRQPLVPGSLTLRIVLLGVVTLLFLVPSVSQPAAAAASLAGLVVGGLVGLWGLRLTQFERTPDRDYYTPNTYLGLAVFGVFLARLAYRLVQVYPLMQAPPAAHSAPNAASLTSSPLTLALFLAVVGYYLCYWAGVLLWYRRHPPGQGLPGGEGQPD